MTDDSLFSLTPTERLAAVAAFVTEERKFRIFMQTRHKDPGQHLYWEKRIAQCDQALAHVEALLAVAP